MGAGSIPSPVPGRVSRGCSPCGHPPPLLPFATRAAPVRSPQERRRAPCPDRGPPRLFDGVHGHFQRRLLEVVSRGALAKSCEMPISPAHTHARTNLRVRMLSVSCPLQVRHARLAKQMRLEEPTTKAIRKTRYGLRHQILRTVAQTDFDRNSPAGHRDWTGVLLGIQLLLRPGELGVTKKKNKFGGSTLRD